MRYAIPFFAIILAGQAALAQPSPAPSVTAPPNSERRMMPIDWKEVREAVQAKRLERTKFRQMTIAANAPQPSLPMLLPVEQRLAAAAVSVFPQGDSYSASMRMGDITVEIHGDRRALVLQDGHPLLRLIKARHTARIAGGDVSVALDKSEGGFDLTFSRFGAAYLVAIECKNPEEERCVKPDFIRALAESMGLFGKDSP
jgi:hypothetical protein